MSSGAHAVIKTSVDRGVAVRFVNPGTSEMHFVFLGELPRNPTGKVHISVATPFEAASRSLETHSTHFVTVT